MWNSDRRQSVSRCKMPVGGGVVGLVALIGMGIVLMGLSLSSAFFGNGDRPWRRNSNRAELGPRPEAELKLSLLSAP